MLASQWYLVYRHRDWVNPERVVWTTHALGTGRLPESVVYPVHQIWAGSPEEAISLILRLKEAT